MSKLWIREYKSRLADARARELPVAAEPGNGTQTVTFTGSSVQSNPFQGDTGYVAVTADAPFHYEVGSDPTATGDSLPVGEKSILFFAVTPGHRIAVIESE